jgi:CRISPR/Cas system-associated endonuclease Cas1
MKNGVNKSMTHQDVHQYIEDQMRAISEQEKKAKIAKNMQKQKLNTSKYLNR